MNDIKEAIQTVHSGEPGSTGREVFEDSTATGPAETFREGGNGAHHGTAGDSVGVGSNTQGGSVGLGQTSGQGIGGVDYAGQTGLNTTGQQGYSTSGQEGLGSAGQIGSQQIGEGEHHHHHHGHHHHHQTSGIQPTSGNQISESYGADTMGNTGNVDRVGDVNQDAALYERTGTSGPATTGAAGTDRFDTDKGLGQTGTTTGTETGSAGNTFGTSNDYPVQDTTQRAEGKGTGGLTGLLTTTDKEFTGRDRTGPVGGAYSDTQGNFQGNTSGPGGNSALTGREGNIENNPVAQAKGDISGNTSTTGTAHDEAQAGAHKESLLEKAKHAVGL